MASWSKQLSDTDAQQNAGNKSNVLRLTRGKEKVDKLTWFRGTLFAPPVVWVPGEDSGQHPIETAQVSFDVTIDGTSRGTQTLTVDCGEHRISGQGNIPTLVHLGPLASELRDTDHSKKTVTIERLAGDDFRLRIG